MFVFSSTRARGGASSAAAPGSGPGGVKRGAGAAGAEDPAGAAAGYEWSVGAMGRLLVDPDGDSQKHVEIGCFAPETHTLEQLLARAREAAAAKARAAARAPAASEGPSTCRRSRAQAEADAAALAAAEAVAAAAAAAAADAAQAEVCRRLGLMGVGVAASRKAAAAAAAGRGLYPTVEDLRREFDCFMEPGRRTQTGEAFASSAAPCYRGRPALALQGACGSAGASWLVLCATLGNNSLRVVVSPSVPGLCHAQSCCTLLRCHAHPLGVKVVLLLRDAVKLVAEERSFRCVRTGWVQGIWMLGLQGLGFKDFGSRGDDPAAGVVAGAACFGPCTQACMPVFGCSSQDWFKPERDACNVPYFAARVGTAARTCQTSGTTAPPAKTDSRGASSGGGGCRSGRLGSAAAEFTASANVDINVRGLFAAARIQSLATHP